MEIFTTDAWVALLEILIPTVIIGAAGTIMEHREERRKETRR